MFIKVKSPPEELAEQYAREEEAAKIYQSVELFLANRAQERLEHIHELSHELAQLRLNYEEAMSALLKHEPGFKHKHPETEYKMESRLVNLL